MKYHVISFMPAQIPYLGKFWFLSYKLSANEKAGFLNQLYMKKKLTDQLDLWHDDVDSRNTEVDL